MATITSAQNGLASDTATWVGGVIPVLGDRVIVDHQVTLDGTYHWGDDTASAIEIRTGGVLQASSTVTSQLTSRGTVTVRDGGSLILGRLSQRLPSSITATLVLNDSAILADGKYGLAVENNAIFRAAGEVKTTNTVTTTQLNIGDTQVIVEDSSGWQVGDTLVISAGDETLSTVTITSISGTQVDITATTGSHPIQSNIANFTKNVKIQAAQDNDSWLTLRTNTTSADIKELSHVEISNVASAASSARFGVNFKGGARDPSAETGITTIDNLTVTTQRRNGFCFDFFQVYTPILLRDLAILAGTSNAFYLRESSSMQIDDTNIYSASVGIFSFYNGGGILTSANRCTFSSTGVSLQTITGGPFQFTDCTFEKSHTVVQPGYGSTVSFNGCTFGDNVRPVSRIVSCLRNCTQQLLFTDCTVPSGTATDNIVANLDLASNTFSANFANLNVDPLQQLVFRQPGLLVRDNSTFRTTAPSINIQHRDSRNLFEFNMNVLAPSNAPVVVSGYIRKDAQYGSQNLPTVTLSGLGITPSTFTIADVNDEWQQFTVSGTQTTGTDGVLTLTFSSQSATGNIYIDDLIAPVARPVSTGDFNFWSGAMPLPGLLSNFVSPQEVWNAQTNEFTLQGSVGADWNQLRTLINQRLDEEISSRASSAEISNLNNLSLSQVENSSVIAKEVTVNTRASQASVDNLPTTAFNDNDRTTLNALSNTSETDIHTALDSYTNKGDYQADTSNLLQTSDVRLSNLDAPVSSRSTFNATTDEVTTAGLSDIAADVADTKQGLLGRWQIVNDQLIMYQEDGATVLRTFNLFDEAGDPTSVNVFRREPV